MSEQQSIVSNVFNGIKNFVSNGAKAVGKSILKKSPWLAAAGLSLWAPLTKVVIESVGSITASLANSGWISQSFAHAVPTFYANYIAGTGTAFLGIPLATGTCAVAAAGICAAYFAYKTITNIPREYHQIKEDNFKTDVLQQLQQVREKQQEISLAKEKGQDGQVLVSQENGQSSVSHESEFLMNKTGRPVRGTRRNPKTTVTGTNQPNTKQTAL